MAEDGEIVQGLLLLNAAQSERGWHLLSSGMTCPQQRKYNELRRAGLIHTPLAGVLVRGSLVHIGAAHFYRRMQALQQGDDPERWHAPLDAVGLLAEEFAAKTRPQDQAHINWDRQLEDAHAALRVMMADSQDRDRNFEVVSVEEQSRVVLRLDPWLPGETQVYSQRQDLIVRDRRSGFFFSLDHKTRARKCPKTERAYMRSGQFQGLQRFGVDRFGKKWGGAFINFVTMPSNGKPARIDRVRAEVKPMRLRDYGQTIAFGEWQWKQVEAMGLEPDRYPKVNGDNGACEHRFGPCPFAKICDFGRDGS